jgi:hypothetical protein
MNKLRSIIFGTTILISTSTSALAGEMQAPTRTEPPPPPPSTTETQNAMTSPTSTEETEIVLQDLATTVLREVLLTIF